MFLPVENIEESVKSQEEDNMGSDVLNIAEFGDHVELG